MTATNLSSSKWIFLFVIITFLLISGCAKHYTAATYSDPYGFFSGVWHGVICPFSILTNLISWILSLFDIYLLYDIQIIGRPNTGFFYYLGFVFGLSGYGGGSSVAN